MSLYQPHQSQCRAERSPASCHCTNTYGNERNVTHAHASMDARARQTNVCGACRGPTSLPVRRLNPVLPWAKAEDPLPCQPVLSPAL
jgi:hypothetical protein